MHGMFNRGLQCYVRDIFGPHVWEETCTRAELPFFNFETMLPYDDDITEAVLTSLSAVLDRPRNEVLEDFGTYVVSEARLSAVRKLLRFGGDTFEEFLHSLEDVHDRAKLALPDLDVPHLRLEPHSETQLTLHYRFAKLGFGTVFLGLLRGMADDYGALVVIDHICNRKGAIDADRFEISLMHLGWTEAVDLQAAAH
ncbi:MAG: heme NO-binding protein [Rhodobacteraceae bacterium]|nr:heme NO-binding protein [Paracoccaceae bacterium]